MKIRLFLLMLSVPFLACFAQAGECDQELISEWSAARVRVVKMDDSKPASPVATISGNGPRTGKASVVSEARAKELFAHLREMRIGHFYIEDGCNSRAHLMAKRLEELGVVSAKAFVWGDPKNRTALLAVKNPYTSTENEDKYTAWVYHVAPALVVADGKGGHSVQVLDPALANGPLPVENWLSRILAPPGIRPEATYFPEPVTKVKRVKIMITDRFEIDLPGEPYFYGSLFSFAWIRNRYDEEEHNLAVRDCARNESKMALARRDFWKWSTRAPASVRKPAQKVADYDGEEWVVRDEWIPNGVSEDENTLWVTFKGRVAFYSVSKKREDFAALKKLIGERIKRGRKLSIDWNLVTLELLKVR